MREHAPDSVAEDKYLYQLRTFHRHKIVAIRLGSSGQNIGALSLLVRAITSNVKCLRKVVPLTLLRASALMRGAERGVFIRRRDLKDSRACDLVAVANTHEGWRRGCADVRGERASWREGTACLRRDANP
jgi:hypothetical protein